METFITRNTAEEFTVVATLDEIVQLRRCRESSRAVGNEGTEAKVIHVVMVVRRQRLITELIGTATDHGARLRDDARMGREHDVLKGFIPFSKVVLNDGVVGGTGRKHVRCS